MLTVGTAMFTLDAQRLVLGPIERIMKRMEELARNPLQEMELEESSSLPWQKVSGMAGNGERGGGRYTHKEVVVCV